MSGTDKNTRILMLYNALLNGYGVDKKTFSIEHNINERTFDRDIEDIRLFLSESFSCDELIFDRESSTYHLSGNRAKYIDRMEATVISKILLESGVLRKDEMCGLLNTIMSAVTQKDAVAIQRFISNDINIYKSNNNDAILKFVEDLIVVINSGYDIRITTINEINGETTYKISPLEIICDNKQFVLVAAQSFDLSNIVRIDIKNIVGFTNLFSSNAEKLRKEYLKTKEN